MSEAYEPLSEIRKNFKVSWYRCPIEPATLRQLTVRNDLQGFLQALGHLLLVAGLGFLVCWFFARRQWVGFGVSLFVFGSVYSFTPFGCHELAHGTVFKTKWLNGFFLRIYSALGWFNYFHYRSSHTYHHLYTLYPRADREVVLPKNPSLQFKHLLQLFTISITGGWESPGLVPTLKATFMLAFLKKPHDEWSRAIFEPADQAKSFRLAVTWARFLVAFYAVILAAGFISGLWLPPVLLVFGSFIFNWWRYFVGVPMHVGLRSNVPDFRLCVRTIKLDPISHFLYWRMNYHTEHHMFAAVPCYRLRDLHKAVAADMPAPRTLVGAWKEMRETWKRQRVDPTYEFQTPLPPPRSAQKQDPLGASLGDLKPATLA
ncbi:MAG TPA: fatty acid desaturase [Spirochaetia bacterium]|nr:fatty acid desaturase [Spirochaetia bacterium]